MSGTAGETRDLAALRWHDHRAALWWLALLYRRPKGFAEALQQLPSLWRRLLVAVGLLLHALPYMFAVGAGGRLLLYAAGIDESLATGATGWQPDFAAIAVAAAYQAAIGIAVEIAVEIAGGIAVGIAFGIAFGIAVGITGGIAGGITGGIAGGIAAGIAAAAATPTVLLRVYYQLYAWIFVWPHVRGAAYRWHPVAWDDLCSVPFPGLDRLLVAYAEHDRAAALAEIARLIETYPSQQQQALRARARLVAREAGAAASLDAIDAIAARLPEGSQGFLAETARVREWIGEIASVQRQLDVADRPLFRAPLAELLVERVEHFAHRIAGLQEPLASEFRPAAANWLAIAQRQRDDARRVREREPVAQVFRAGDPVDRENEAFVARLGVVGEVERQVMLSTGCPGIVLYGRRRTGKSTVLVWCLSFSFTS